MTQQVAQQAAAKVAAFAVDSATKARVLAESGIIRPYSPITLARMGKTLLDWGVGPAGGFAALAVRSPDGVGLVDELGELTYKEIDERGTALADSLRELGVKDGESVAIMVRNHRGFIDASLAAAKLGADILYLNTAFAGPQLVEVLDREGPTVLVYDQEFTELLSDVGDDIKRVVAWTDDDDDNPGTDAGEVPTVEELVAKGSSSASLTAPEKPSRIVILTSGTTGTPKGAPRNEAGIDAAVALLSRMPLRRGWTTHIAAPLFHTWGWAHLALAMLLESKVVLTRKFDPEG
jgi:acyl-CoA synthetase (AMP-forming)/AMP-acid ligase II